MVDEAPRCIYLDASALVKLVITEAETESLREYLNGFSEGRLLLSSRVADIEVRRVAGRQDEQPADAIVAQVLTGTSLVELDASIARAAGEIGPPSLRSLDALHLASALSVRDALDALVTYDARLADAARAAGLTVVAPA